MINYVATPIYRMDYVDSHNDFYIKRDDLFPISFGGNKARKAVLFYEDINKKGSDCVVSYGSHSSNHCRVIANQAARYNLKCHIISPEEDGHPSANGRLIELFGATITRCHLSQVSKVIDEKIKELIEKGHKPYFIPGGGHGYIGTKAYVVAYQEIVAYEKEKGVHFDYIFLATGTGTTQAGLVCGKAVHGDERTIVGISIARKNPHGIEVVEKSVIEYLSLTYTDMVHRNINSKDRKSVV